MPGRRPDECEVEGYGESERDSGNQSVGLFRGSRKPVNQPAGDEHSPARSDQKNQGVIEGDLFEHHPFLAHEKEDYKVAQPVSDELGGAGRQTCEPERRPRKERRERLPETRLTCCRLIRNTIQTAAPGFVDEKKDRDRREQADAAKKKKCVTPTESGGDGSTEGDSQCRSERRAEIVKTKRSPPAAGWKIIGNNRIGGRNAASFAKADRHVCDDKLRISYCQAAAHGCRAPNRARCRQHFRPVRLVSHPTDRNRDKTIKEREVEAAGQAKLTVRDVQTILNRLRKDGRKLTRQKVQDIYKPQHAEGNPRTSSGNRSLRFRRWLGLCEINLCEVRPHSRLAVVTHANVPPMDR